MLNKVLRRLRRKPERVAFVPEGTRVYAVGDIHGRSDLLRELLDLVSADAAASPEPEKSIVYLGDYIDRGLDSRGVIDMVLDGTPEGLTPVWLAGNHEEAMLDFLADPHAGAAWLGFGGAEALVSYGVSMPGRIDDEASLSVARRELERAVPERHLEFLRGLALNYRAGDYFFVHAGVRPGIAIEDQSRADMLWIRDEFLGSRADHGPVIVHGHSIGLTAEFQDNRIGIDTGAYASGVLTCLVLSGSERSLLQTGQKQPGKRARP